VHLTIDYDAIVGSMTLLVSKKMLAVDMKCDAQFYPSRWTTGDMLHSRRIVIVATIKCFDSGGR
jgi:hypothetical protein